MVLTIKSGGVNKIKRQRPISLTHVTLWCLFIDPHLTTHQPNVGVR